MPAARPRVAPVPTGRARHAWYPAADVRDARQRSGGSWLRRILVAGDRRLIVKLTVPTILLTLGLTLVFGQIFGAIFERAHERSSDERARRLADAAEAGFMRDWRTGHGELLEHLDLLCSAAVKSVFVADAAGKVTLACDRSLVGAVVDPSAAAPSSLTRAGQRWHRLIRPIAASETCAGCHEQRGAIGFVGVDSPQQHADHEVREQKRLNLIGGGVLSITLSLTLVAVMVVVIHRPVRQLTRTVERIRAGDLTARTALPRRDELGGLAASLDHLAESMMQAKVELERTHRAELAQAEKLAALGQLTSSIAHEIKNPLAGIIGALRVVEKESPEHDPNKPILGKVLAQMERLATTAVELLKFARPLAPAVTDIDLAETVDRALFFVERQAASQGVEVRRWYDPGVPAVRVDPELMKQVFLNLLLNGVDAMPEGGRLDVHIRRAAGAAPFVELVVSDQGVGISPAHLAHIFSPFFSTKPRGTGLGLYVARQIIETQKGEISVDSHLGQGTAFTVRLPVAPSAAEGSRDAAG
jgi:signal transduction histidine kinase